MTRRAKQVTDAALIDALEKHGGNKSAAAKACGITRQTVQERVEKSFAMQEAIRVADERLLDIAESHLVRYVKRGDKDMVKFQLTQRGRKRGYGNNVSVGLDESQAAAIVAGLGGSAEAFRDALVRLGVNSAEIP